MRQEIKALLGDASAQKRSEGLGLLMRRQDYRLLPQSASLMADPDQAVGALAKRVSLFLAEGCIKKDSPAVPRQVIALAKTLIQTHEPDFIRAAYDRLGDTQLEGVLDALVVLRHFVDEQKAEEILQRFLSHSHNKVRATASLHIGLVAAKKNPALLVRFLEDSDNRVRANTIEVIEKLKNKSMVRVLERFREDKNNRVRANVLKALFSLGKRDLFEDVTTMLTHEKALMRTSAVWLIGEIGREDVRYLELLQMVQDDPDELLCNNLIIVTKKVGNLPALNFLSKKLDGEIKKRLKAKILKNAKLEIEPVTRERYVLLKLSGSITIDTILTLKLYLQDMDLAIRNEIVLDFREVEYLDSSGVALLANFSKKVAATNGFFYIFGCNYRISEFFQLSRIDKTLSIFQTEEEIREFIYF